MNGRAGVLALARPKAPPGRPALKVSRTMADDNRPTLPSMANPTPTSTPAPRPRRLSLFGPPVAAVEALAKEMALINQAPLLAIRAVMQRGQRLDDPTASQPAAPAAEPPTTPTVKPAPEQPTRAIGTGLH